MLALKKIIQFMRLVKITLYQVLYLDAKLRYRTTEEILEQCWRKK